MESIGSQHNCYFVKFGIIVTGETEENHMPKLFKFLAEMKICSFQVIKRVGQRSPITSEKKKLKMVGSGKILPDKDACDIGFPARAFLKSDPYSYLILIDDLENDRRGCWRQVFERYRQALDHILLETKERERASVHFLVNMLEAYYFANADSINKTLGTSLVDYDGDVETIRHPKQELKTVFPGFDEKLHGGEILSLLNIPHVLSRENTCSSLRTLFLWCLQALKGSVSEEMTQCHDLLQSTIQSLHQGMLCEITRYQILPESQEASNS